MTTRAVALRAKKENIRSNMFEQAFKNIDDVLWKEAGWGTLAAHLFVESQPFEFVND